MEHNYTHIFVLWWRRYFGYQRGKLQALEQADLLQDIEEVLLPHLHPAAIARPPRFIPTWNHLDFVRVVSLLSLIRLSDVGLQRNDIH